MNVSSGLPKGCVIVIRVFSKEFQVNPSLLFWPASSSTKGCVSSKLKGFGQRFQGIFTSGTNPDSFETVLLFLFFSTFRFRSKFLKNEIYLEEIERKTS